MFGRSMKFEELIKILKEFEENKMFYISTRYVPFEIKLTDPEKSVNNEKLADDKVNINKRKNEDDRIINLKKELDSLILIEDYEKAVIVRDKIKKYNEIEKYNEKYKKENNQKLLNLLHLKKLAIKNEQFEEAIKYRDEINDIISKLKNYE